MENSFNADVNTKHTTYHVTIMPQVMILQKFRILALFPHKADFTATCEANKQTQSRIK